MDNALLRIPALNDTGVRKFYNGPESFTPDNQFILGEAPELAGFYVGAGFNSVGIASAGGAGRALAEWIVEGEPTSDLTGVDIRRFAPFNGNVRWLRDRVGEVLGLHYQVPWPNREMSTARPFRRSPVHHLMVGANANFGSRMGWERVNFFAPPGQEPVIDYAWGKQNWLPWSAAEQTSTRTGVTVFDQTSFSKYVLRGPDAEAALQWLCTADVAVPVGRAVYTGMLNRRGTYESDVTVTRTAEDEYLIVSSAATTQRDQDHIRRNLPPGSDVTLVDVTSSLAVFGVMGPRSRELLARLTGSDLRNDAFPFGTSRQVELGYATVRATRITYVGELGWELYVPVELAVGVYEDLMAAGEELGVGRGGYYAIESMRLEKGYRAFGRDLGPDNDPVEAGLLFACKLRSDVPFLGRPAVERARAEGPRRRLVSFVVDDPDPMLWGSELVLRDGRPAGQVTSAAWGETCGGCVGLAYLWTGDGGVVTADWLRRGGYQVDVGGTRVPVTVSTKPPYDPTNARVRS
jgi:4-methylaminobutanoate oxidase (formaldehyde-forming)